MDPIPYLEFLGLQMDAAVVVTDSGGIQEETSFLGVPCLTVRENTERPITISRGTNLLVGAPVLLTTTDNVTWTLGGLSGLTAAPGTYVLTLTTSGGGIADLQGRPLGLGASVTWLR